MKKYLFTIYLTGYGYDPDEAWMDAAEHTDLDSDTTPDDWREIEDGENDE